jgi:RNA polymerase sigma-70 factor (ECF subfamily)
MAETSQATLRHLLLAGYDDFVRWLTSRVGCAELARDAMQDAFLRLERSNDIGPVQNPRAYLLRMALNLASNRRLADSRHLTFIEVEALLEIADDAPDPIRTAEARSELDALKRALAELPVRRRDIFLAAWVEEIPHQEIAARFGVSVRTVQLELKQALEYCALRLNRDIRKNFASRPQRLS